MKIDCEHVYGYDEKLEILLHDPEQLDGSLDQIVFGFCPSCGSQLIWYDQTIKGVVNENE